MKTEIIVVTHKYFDDTILPPEGYRVVSVGGLNSNWDTDGEGENIALENPYYCELTAQYNQWKNRAKEVEITGLVHYRRYFMNYKKGSQNFSEDILTRQEIETIFSEGMYKIILPFKGSKHLNSSILYRNKSLDEQDKHWLIIKQLIENNYPDYIDSFEKIIYGKTQVWWNMFISTSEVFDSYSEWLFSLLKKYDEYIENTLLEKRIPRVDGFLAELLLLVWVDKNIKINEIKYLDVKNTESNKLSYDNDLLGAIRKHIYCNERVLKIFKNTKRTIKVFYMNVFKGL